MNFRGHGVSPQEESLFKKILNGYRAVTVNLQRVFLAFVLPQTAEFGICPTRRLC